MVSGKTSLKNLFSNFKDRWYSKLVRLLGLVKLTVLVLKMKELLKVTLLLIVQMQMLFLEELLEGVE